MTAILTNNFRLKQAELFIEAFETSAEKNMYLGIGRSNPWPNDLIPEIPIDNITNISDAYATLIGLKKLSVSDVINVVPRFDWAENTVYVPYSNIDENLFFHPTSAEITANTIAGFGSGSFYVVTDEYNVYKCLKANGPSTAKPALTILTPFDTADGYIWKYLFTLAPAVIDKFLSDSWMPVRVLSEDDGSLQWQVQQNAVPGSINYIDILDGGSTYSKVFSGTVVAASGTTITFDIAVGSTDLTDETVYISAGLGNGQFYRIESYNTGTKVATIDGTFSPVPNSASTYQILPTITLTGNGSGFKARPVIESDEIVDVVIQNPGENYTFGNIVLSTGVGYDLNASVSPLTGHGSNPVVELGGSYLMISSLLEYDEESNIITDNDYRRLLLISNLLNPDDEIATGITLSALKSITIDNKIGEFVQDEIVEVSNGAKIFIVSIKDDELFYMQNSSTGTDVFTTSHTLTGLTSGATADITTLNDSDIKENSGDIIYIKNMRPVLRSPTLIEDIKILIKF